MIGHIKKIVSDRGFGFITVDKTDYFFHRSACLIRFEQLREGDSVSFDVEDHEKGPRAVDVELA